MPDLQGLLNQIYDSTNNALRVSASGTSSAAAPVVVRSTGPDLTIDTTLQQWKDVDPNGTSAARPLDVVIPGVAVGDWIKVEADFASLSATAGGVLMTMATVVAGAVVHRIGPAPAGTFGGHIPSWVLFATEVSSAGPPAWYQLQTGDIESGSVRLRLQSFNLNAAARTIDVVDYGLALVGSGPFV